MNEILAEFNQYAINAQKQFTHQLGNNEDSINLLSHVWQSNYNKDSFVWIRSAMFDNFESLIPKLNNIGIRVFKPKIDDKFEKLLLLWAQDIDTDFVEYECK